jgi:predicted ATPase
VTGESDAYATGQSLVALREARILRSDAPEYSKAIAFLMRTQEPDGSWHVSTRGQPIQKYFETGFAHGKDQFISYAATCWATMAILNDDGAHRSMAAAFKSRH